MFQNVQLQAMGDSCGMFVGNLESRRIVCQYYICSKRRRKRSRWVYIYAFPFLNECFKKKINSCFFYLRFLLQYVWMVVHQLIIYTEVLELESIAGWFSLRSCSVFLYLVSLVFCLFLLVLTRCSYKIWSLWYLWDDSEWRFCGNDWFLGRRMV